MEKIIQQSLFGPELDIVLNPDKTDKIIKKLKKPKKVINVSNLTVDQILKNKKISFEIKLGKVKEEVERILGGYKSDTICIYDRNEFHDYISAAIDNKIIAIDTETLGTRTDIKKPGTDPFTCRLAGLCLYTPGQKNAYIPINHVDYQTGERWENQLTENDVYEELSRLVAAKTFNLFQNGKFDYMVLYYTCGIKVPITWDTMIGSQVLNENEEAGLKFQYRDKINPEQEKYDIDKLFDLEILDKYPCDLFSLYAATDAYMTYELYEYQKKEFEKRGNERLYNLFLNIEMPVVTVCAEMQMRGVGLDRDFASRLSLKYHKKLDVVESNISAELDKYSDVISQWRQTPEANQKEKVRPSDRVKDLKKFPYKDSIGNFKWGKSMNEKLLDPIEITSNEQLGILLYDILGWLKSTEKDENGDDKKPVDEATLLTIKDKSPLIPLILKKREYDKYLGTYIDALPVLASPRDDRIHPKFNQLGREEKGVVTGRFSSTDPNFQNIPARGNITSVRCMITPTVEYNEVNSHNGEYIVPETDEVMMDDGTYKWAVELSKGDLLENGDHVDHIEIIDKLVNIYIKAE